ncbi:6966_t:CDS:2 [Cetraspora pellucida]|uniref:6966_t:CDS:1 n=1 Tax=Cetraspora pellucida TaxID=1433469 RepID=A0A9N8WGB9_9GLOM|nr:6966_t:CDS:2 [Cetraspora pellucida]
MTVLIKTEKLTINLQPNCHVQRLLQLIIMPRSLASLIEGML